QRVMVYPQGVGAYQDWFSSSGETGDSFVIDVGFNTVDLVAIRNGAPSRSLSGMLDQAGISRPIGELRDYLLRQHKVDLAPQQAKEIFNAREFRLYGNAVDVSAPIREILEEYAEWLFRSIE